MNFTKSTLLRLEAMDAQRFDLSKRRKNPLNLVISTVAPSVHSEESGIPQINVISPESSPSDETSTANESSSSNDDSTMSSSPTVFEATIFSHKNDAQSTDIFERDGYTTTRTIIRPTSPESQLLSIFSRPSSPATSRPTPPLGARLASLNCIGIADAFEEELNFILQQRENDLAGVTTPEIQVKVTQDQAVFYEEKWRDAIQALLYEPTPPIVSCVGHAH